MTPAERRLRERVVRAIGRFYRHYQVESAALEGTYPKDIVDAHRAYAALAAHRRRRK